MKQNTSELDKSIARMRQHHQTLQEQNDFLMKNRVKIGFGLFFVLSLILWAIF